MIMEKKVIDAIIERAEDGTYDVYCTKEMFAGAWLRLRKPRRI